MKLKYGYAESGEFVIAVLDHMNQIQQLITISRPSAQKVSKHMLYGKKGETRTIEGIDQAEVPPPLMDWV